ncbi:hypothetical protein SV7mr_02070 [Stieleria bergensis]|uniref:Thioredoxin domain-containing protein n=1 Tax=Stieleria bergensis TaxID=2528025 RepID=A0A517SNM8_9BACT|nr:MAG: hypothetical protein CBB71_13920 [Rhodopirellula sp. TMED11]QDT57723.1 hypothetical protein SV7mr_02070 [Planctomycetes bacterium SV_7m_r]
MSRLITSVAAVAMLLGSINLAAAGEGLKTGDGIGAFYVTKVCGADSDGVDQGEQLCYRCRYGSRPMVMVFARSTDGKVSKLVKELDAAVEANKDAQLKGFVTLMGKDASALKDSAKAVVSDSGAKNIPVTIAKDNVSGPSNYKIDADAEVTVIVAAGGRVVANHSSSAAELNVDKVIGAVNKAVN